MIDYTLDALDKVIKAKAFSLQIDDSLQTFLMRSADEKDWETKEYKRLLKETRAIEFEKPPKELLSLGDTKESTTPPKV